MKADIEGSLFCLAHRMAASNTLTGQFEKKFTEKAQTGDVLRQAVGHRSEKWIR